MKASLAAAVEINEGWSGMVARLPLPVGTLALYGAPDNDEVAAIIEKHCTCPEETK